MCDLVHKLWKFMFSFLQLTKSLNILTLKLYIENCLDQNLENKNTKCFQNSNTSVPNPAIIPGLLITNTRFVEKVAVFL